MAHLNLLLTLVGSFTRGKQTMAILKKTGLSIFAAAFLVLAMQTAAESATVENTKIMDREAQQCVAEIARRADYSSASRVVHMIMDAKQKNLAQQQFRINTLIYAGDGEAAIREYRSTCVTHGVLNIVKFEIDQYVGS